MNNYSNYIAIVGAGIAGLTLGNILKINNIPCVIFEKSKNINEYGAGISISSNGLKVLDSLKILDPLNNISSQPSQASFFSNGKKIKNIPVNITTASRKNLYKLLLNKYLSLNGDIFFNHEVIDVKSDNKEIHFSNNQKYNFSHIASCDGIKSICQRKISTSFDNPKYSGYYVWRTIFKSNQKDIRFYLGPNHHVVTYPIDKERVSFISAIKSKNQKHESWRQEGSIKDLLFELPQSLISMYPNIQNNNGVYKWGVYLRPNCNKLYDKNVTYLGDAAHPIVPFIGQGACLALEDAFIFGQLLKKYSNDYSLSQYKYNLLRIDRIRSIYTKSLHQGKLNHLSNPFLVYMRNLLMKYTNVINDRTKEIWSYDVRTIINKLE